MFFLVIYMSNYYYRKKLLKLVIVEIEVKLFVLVIVFLKRIFKKNNFKI